MKVEYEGGTEVIRGFFFPNYFRYTDGNPSHTLTSLLGVDSTDVCSV